jgi:hypothetical protein
MKTGQLALLLALLLALPAAALGQVRSGLPLPASGDVTLPLEEYNKLVDLANKPAKKPDAPPFPYSIKRAEMKLQVTGESASGSIQLEGEVFGKGVTRVPLVTGLTILNAQEKGRELPLQQEGGTHTAILPGPAEFNITLETGLPLNIEAGRASLSLPAPAAGTVRLTLSIPGDHTNVNLSRGLITGRSSSNGQTTIEATLEPAQQATLWWATRENAAPPAPREVRFLSEVKTLVSVSEAELGMAALADITVVQGDPAEFQVQIPPGYEVTGATGASLESSEEDADVLTLKVANPALRSHQFLITMEKSIDAPKAELPFPSFKGSQRETGEVLVESEGTMELTAKESGSLKRMDVKETNPFLRSLARHSLQAAFRYHRQPTEAPGLALEWVRFADYAVLAAVAQQATVTTLVTSDGKSLSEVKLVLKNQAQPFLKVNLPAGASIVSAVVAGETVKPVEGADGNRVPLLRPGFRPAGSYSVSFVFMHSGTPFEKKGDAELTLPKMDLPIGLLEWEVFLPERYKVTDFGGDAIPARLLPVAPEEEAAVTATGAGVYSSNGTQPNGALDLTGRDAGELLEVMPGFADVDNLRPGQLGGFVVDQAGAIVPNAHVIVTHIQTGASRRTRTDAGGRWVVSDMPSGRVNITVQAAGFTREEQQIEYEASRPSRFSCVLKIGSVTDKIEVVSSSEAIARASQQVEREARKAAAQVENAPSSNVMNLQKRVAGVLPIRVDVPRAGNSYRFVRPLVIDEETKVTFNYRTEVGKTKR